MAIMNKVFIYSTSPRYSHLESYLKKKSAKVLRMLKKDGVSFEIFLVLEKEIKKINRERRNKNRTTNVLSFCEPKNFVYPKEKYKRMGEIFISPDFVKKAGQEINLMLVHGILHLFGFDHIRKNEALKMERKEALLLKSLLEK